VQPVSAATDVRFAAFTRMADNVMIYKYVSLFCSGYVAHL
jgi:hypothetical protein